MSEGAPARARPEPNQVDAVRRYLKQQESNDLVFAVAGHIGSGCTWVASVLSEQLRQAGYTPQEFKLSDLIAKSFDLGASSRDPLVATTTKFQDCGDELRGRHGNSIVAGLAVQQIHELRRVPTNDSSRAFVLDSLKNPEEVEVLRAVYGSSFYLIGVLANQETRLDRLNVKYKHDKSFSNSGKKVAGIELLMERDAAGAEDHEQHVRKTVKLSDFFIANDGDDLDTLGTALKRFIDAITRATITRPTPSEKGMHAAWSAALKSSCLSRQVGASIVSEHGELLAVGTNDPPAPGGGIYDSGKGEGHDFRCFNYPDAEYSPQTGFCRNDRIKNQIYDDIYDEMASSSLLASGATPEAIRKAVGKTRVKDLIEFSRAIHAEMDALLSLARNGLTLPPRATLYCTTYPCHSCARHIVAAGIHTVFYIEPYPKSLALDLHGDAICNTTVASSAEQNTSASQAKVVFALFTGVAPRAFAALFEKRGEVKDSKTGILIPISRRAPKHGNPMLTGSFLDLEKNVATTVTNLLQQTEVSDGD